MIMKQVDQKSHSTNKPASAGMYQGFRNQNHQASFDSTSFSSTLQSNLSS